mmetsp:Transcript_26578/g.30514  ORF Transcript_26578/g.30514 Transcript_26578/m.30514 type:complete len:380 (-) Transcript_26578:963-2102(-)
MISLPLILFDCLSRLERLAILQIIIINMIISFDLFQLLVKLSFILFRETVVFSLNDDFVSGVEVTSFFGFVSNTFSDDGLKNENNVFQDDENSQFGSNRRTFHEISGEKNKTDVGNNGDSGNNTDDSSPGSDVLSQSGNGSLLQIAQFEGIDSDFQHVVEESKGGDKRETNTEHSNVAELNGHFQVVTHGTFISSQLGLFFRGEQESSGNVFGVLQSGFFFLLFQPGHEERKTQFDGIHGNVDNENSGQLNLQLIHKLASTCGDVCFIIFTLVSDVDGVDEGNVEERDVTVNKLEQENFQDQVIFVFSFSSVIFPVVEFGSSNSVQDVENFDLDGVKDTGPEFGAGVITVVLQVHQDHDGKNDQTDNNGSSQQRNDQFH